MKNITFLTIVLVGVSTLILFSGAQTTVAETKKTPERGDLQETVSDLENRVRQLESRLLKMETEKRAYSLVLPNRSNLTFFAKPSATSERHGTVWGRGEVNGWEYQDIPLSNSK